MTAPIPGPPRVDFTITWGADLYEPIRRRNKATEADLPYPAGTTAVVRLGAQKPKADPISCEVDGAVIALHIESGVLDTLGAGPVDYQILVSEPGGTATPDAILVGRLIR